MVIQTGTWMPAPVAAERSIVAIGDVHGRDDLLAFLLTYLSEKVLPRLRDPLLVFLGDFLGKGPKGIAALTRAHSFRCQGVETVLLPGNHEQAALSAYALEDLAARDFIWHGWSRSIGRTILAEIGLAQDTRADIGAAALACVLNGVMVDLIGKPVARQVGSWILVHGAATEGCLEKIFVPELPPVDPENHPLWAKAWHRALVSPLPSGVAVLHGHVPCLQVEILPWRVNIDTKAWSTGILTAVEIEGSRMRFHQAIGPTYGPEKNKIAYNREVSGCEKQDDVKTQ